MSEWDYIYCESEGLEFIIHSHNDKLMFDVDYNGDFLILDLGDCLEVNI